MDGDTDGGREDRRWDIHTLLSIEFPVTNGFSRRGRLHTQYVPKQRHEHTNLQHTSKDIVICCLHLLQALRKTGYCWEFPFSKSFVAMTYTHNHTLINAPHQWSLIIKTD